MAESDHLALLGSMHVIAKMNLPKGGQKMSTGHDWELADWWSQQELENTIAAPFMIQPCVIRIMEKLFHCVLKLYGVEISYLGLWIVNKSIPPFTLASDHD